MNFDEINLKSLVLTGYGLKSYQLDRIDAYLEELKELNANTASLLYTCHTKTKSSHNVDCTSYDSPSLEEISDAITRAKQSDYIINLRYYIDMSSGGWRCHWDPKNKDKAFKNIKESLIKVAHFAEKRKVEILTIGAELCKLTTKAHTAKWKQIIKEVRKNFKGKITYGANWGNVDGSIEWKEIGFWKELDYIGIDHYRPIPNEIPHKDIKDFQTIHINEYLKLSQKYHKEIIINEIGFPGNEYGNLNPFDWTLKGKSNEVKQALYYKNTLNALKDIEKIKGIFIWRKESQDTKMMLKYEPDANGYQLYKRKAWYEIQRFFNIF
jgi:hypothetical protein